MKVLFSRGRNDFEHVYELPSVPRIGEHVGLLKSPIMSFPQVYTVTHIYWSPDHTAYDVSVGLEKADNEHVTDQDDNQLQASEHDLALAILDAGDNQGWDRLTWTADADEYNASYGHDDEGNEFDPVPTASALEFARFLLRDYHIVKKPT